MFDKFKQVKKLREMQNNLAKEMVETEEKGIKVVMNGKMEVQEIKILSEMDKEEMEKAIKGAVNSCLKQVQTVAAQKMQDMGGF